MRRRSVAVAMPQNCSDQSVQRTSLAVAWCVTVAGQLLGRWQSLDSRLVAWQSLGRLAVAWSVAVAWQSLDRWQALGNRFVVTKHVLRVCVMRGRAQHLLFKQPPSHIAVSAAA